MPQIEDFDNILADLSRDYNDPEIMIKGFGYFLKHFMMEDEDTVPDPFGCETIFIESLLACGNDQFYDDFPLIAKDFFTHEYANLEKYKRRLYTEDPFRYMEPENAWRVKVLYLILEASNRGSAYAKGLLINIYSTYFRREYRQLRKFRKVTEGDVRSLSGGYEETDFSPMTMARILCMAKVMDIEIDSSCNFIYEFFNKGVNESENRKFPEYPRFPEDAFDKAGNELRQLYPSIRDQNKAFRRLDKFVRLVLKDGGHPDDYLNITVESDEQRRIYLQRTVMLLKHAFPKDEIPGPVFSADTVPLYAMIMHLIGNVFDDLGILEESADQVLGIDDGDYYDNFPPLFRPEKTKEVSQEKKIELKPASPVIQKTDTSVSQEELIAEIQDLQSRLHQEEGRSTHFRELYKKEQDERQNLEKIQREYESDHEELAALREHLYHLTEYDQEVPEADVAGMEDAIKNLRIIIVGGNDNWVKKLRNEFPNWTFISPSVSGSIDAHMVDKADYVYLFTDTLGHTNYYKFMNAIREAEVPFGYMHGVNIKKNIRQVYEDTQGD